LHLAAFLVSRPFHGLLHLLAFPSNELLGYYHSFAIADWPESRRASNKLGLIA